MIEDEPRIREFLRDGLEAEGFVVDGAEDGMAGLGSRSAGRTSSSILDLLLPRLDGFRLLPELRRARRDMAVLILSARSDLPTKLRGFDLGANDYLAKPFSFEELVARVRVHVRRGGDASDGSAVGPGRSTSISHAACAASEERGVDLSDREFRLLYHLVFHAGRGGQPRAPALRGVGVQLRPGLERRRRVRPAAAEEARMRLADRDGEECRLPALPRPSSRRARLGCPCGCVRGDHGRLDFLGDDPVPRHLDHA